MIRTDPCSRRRFCRRLLAGCGLLLWGGVRPAAAASPYGRPLGHLARAQLPAALQAGSNPHLVFPHRQLQHFELTAARQSVPGAVFTTGGFPVRAAASGIVHFIGQRPAPASGSAGYYIRIAHDLYDGLQQPVYPRVTLYRHQAYRSTYYGLESVSVEHWQSVRSGQIVGQAVPIGVSGEPAVKLVLEERGNPVNPDHYGPGHRFMRYGSDHRLPEAHLEEMHRRIKRQMQVIERLNGYYVDRSKDDIHKKIHGVIDTEKFTGYPVRWSSVDQLRYLQHRHRTSPDRFPRLSSEALDSLIRTFLDNQPIVLTLPLAKPV